MNDEEFGSRKLLKLKYRRGGPNNSDILQNWSPLVLIAGFKAGLAGLKLVYPENPALKPRKPS